MYELAFALMTLLVGSLGSSSRRYFSGVFTNFSLVMGPGYSLISSSGWYYTVVLPYFTSLYFAYFFHFLSQGLWTTQMDYSHSAKYALFCFLCASAYTLTSSCKVFLNSSRFSMGGWLGSVTATEVSCWWPSDYISLSSSKPLRWLDYTLLVCENSNWTWFWRVLASRGTS
jgi:hypothetical protein